MKVPEWREPMPQTVEAYKDLAQRDLQLIMEQRSEISKLKREINDLRQKLNKGRYIPVRKLKKEKAA